MSEQTEIKFKCLGYVNQNSSSTEEMIKEAQKIYDFVTTENKSKVSLDEFQAMMRQYFVEHQKTSY